MAKKEVKKKKSKVVSVQEDGTEVYGFEEKPTRKLENDMSKHPKFDKFKNK